MPDHTLAALDAADTQARAEIDEIEHLRCDGGIRLDQMGEKCPRCGATENDFCGAPLPEPAPREGGEG